MRWRFASETRASGTLRMTRDMIEGWVPSSAARYFRVIRGIMATLGCLSTDSRTLGCDVGHKSTVALVRVVPQARSARQHPVRQALVRDSAGLREKLHATVTLPAPHPPLK